MAGGILLEAGTNEMELLIFRIDKVLFGINVAKVREIIKQVEIIKIPYASKSVSGSFKLRDNIYTLVNIGAHFEMPGQESTQNEGMIIVVEFNNLRCGILVDAVDSIHRLKWEAIQPPSKYLVDFEVPVTGITVTNEGTVLIADFETIIGDILGVDNAVIPPHDTPKGVTKSSARILLADDSSVIRQSLEKILHNEGFTNLTFCADGQQAWDTISNSRNDDEGAFDLILSDIEMPRMDGLHLTSKIKSDPQLKHIPVILFSSLITADNINKCQAVGADAQFSKPDSAEMMQKIYQLLEA